MKPSYPQLGLCQGYWAGAGRGLWRIFRVAAAGHHGKILPPSDMALTSPAAAAGCGAAVCGSRQKGDSRFSSGAEGGGGDGGGGGGAFQWPGC